MFSAGHHAHGWIARRQETDIRLGGSVQDHNITKGCQELCSRTVRRAPWQVPVTRRVSLTWLVLRSHRRYVSENRLDDNAVECSKTQGKERFSPDQQRLTFAGEES